MAAGTISSRTACRMRRSRRPRFWGDGGRRPALRRRPRRATAQPRTGRRPSAVAPAWLSAPAAPEATRVPLRPSGAGRRARQRRRAPPRGPARPCAAEPAARGRRRTARGQAAKALSRRAWRPRFRKQRATRSPTRSLAEVESPELAPLFGPRLARRSLRSPAGSSGRDGRALPLAGRLDRLAVTDDAILIADFKLGRRAGAAGGRACRPARALPRRPAPLYPSLPGARHARLSRRAGH